MESEHGKLKQLIKPACGFKVMKSAYATIKGFEIMRMLKEGQLRIWQNLNGGGVKCEVNLINKLFEIYAV